MNDCTNRSNTIGVWRNYGPVDRENDRRHSRTIASRHVDYDLLAIPAVKASIASAFYRLSRARARASRVLQTRTRPLKKSRDL